MEFDEASEADPWERLPPLLRSLADLGADPDDADEQALHRQVLNLATALMVAMSPVWVTTYLVLGHELAAAIPLIWIVAGVALIISHARLGHFDTFRLCALSMMLAFPFGLMWSLGGFANSSAVGLWGLTAPMGAMFFSGPRSSLRWFSGFVLFVVASTLLDPALSDSPPDIPEPIRIIFFGLNFTAVSTTVIVLLHYFVRGRERERARSERLLLNTLPAAIAARLKRGEGVIADSCPEATVLFADLVGFTTLAEGMNADEVVRLLDRIFSGWDDLTAAHGLEKIKTIGDEYMVVGGVPDPRPDHTVAVARMALRMQDALSAAARPLSRPLTARIGIDTGPVVAGVIGRTKFSYDLWGQTVNTASRMESEGEPGRIQITERMRGSLGDRFTASRRGTIEIKGIGEMTTWFLEAEAGADAGSSSGADQALPADADDVAVETARCGTGEPGNRLSDIDR